VAGVLYQVGFHNAGSTTMSMNELKQRLEDGKTSVDIRDAPLNNVLPLQQAPSAAIVALIRKEFERRSPLHHYRALAWTPAIFYRFYTMRMTRNLSLRLDLA
jgi:hypothetical protein